jgi:hypothetical protein
VAAEMTEADLRNSRRETVLFSMGLWGSPRDGRPMAARRPPKKYWPSGAVNAFMPAATP